MGRSRQATEKKDENRVFVQLRLPKELGDTLKKAGKDANRKLPSEIIYRLQQGSAAPVSLEGLVYGWPNPERVKALADGLAVLAGRIEEVGPMSSNRERDKVGVLAMLKIAMADVLDRLGADDQRLSAEEKSFAALEARQFANELLRPDPGPNSIGPRPDLEIIAKLAKAWGVKGGAP